MTTLIVAMRQGLTQVKEGQHELLRQLVAVHKRMDEYGKRLTKTERDHAVLEERVQNMRETDTQRLRHIRRNGVDEWVEQGRGENAE